MEGCIEIIKSTLFKIYYIIIISLTEAKFEQTSLEYIRKEHIH